MSSRFHNFEAIQKEARELLHALKRQDIAGIAPYRPVDSMDTSSDARIADAQYLVARRYGFRSWAELKDCLNVMGTERGPDDSQ